MIAGLDIKGFVLKVLGGALGGWISEYVVGHQEIFGMLGNWALPVVGIVAGLGSQYLSRKGTIPYELATILEYSGAMIVGNWLWENLKTGFKGITGTSGTKAVTVYVPPVKIKKPREAIVL